jgi:hypothetical protein
LASKNYFTTKDTKDTKNTHKMPVITPVFFLSPVLVFLFVVFAGRPHFAIWIGLRVLRAFVVK